MKIFFVADGKNYVSKLQILHKWYTKNTLTVKDLIEKMITWQKERYLDKKIWLHLPSKIDSALMLNSYLSILNLPAPPEGPNPFVCISLQYFLRT